jgi:hypothetical protein
MRNWATSKTWNGPSGTTTELYNNWRTCSYTSFSQQSVAKNMADFEWKLRHFHDNTYFIFMVGTTDQAQFWAHGRFHTPLVFAKSFADIIVLVVLNRFLKIFRYKFSTFDYLDKDMQVVRVILARERRQTNLKPQEMWEKTRLEYGFTKGKRQIFIFQFFNI